MSSNYMSKKQVKEKNKSMHECMGTTQKGEGKQESKT